MRISDFLSKIFKRNNSAIFEVQSEEYGFILMRIKAPAETETNLFEVDFSYDPNFSELACETRAFGLFYQMTDILENLNIKIV